MENGRYEITQREDNLRYLVVLRDDRGKVILTSQHREVKPMCINEIDWIRRCGPEDDFYERIDIEGAWSYVLHARDAHILGTGPKFETEEERERGIVAVKKYAPEASLFDLTPAIDLSTRIPETLRQHARETVELAEAGKACFRRAAVWSDSR